MHRLILLSLAFMCLANEVAAAAEGPPPWAYGFKDLAAPAISAPANATASPADKRTYSLPGSSLQFTKAQINDPFGPADWFPGDHPAMPAIVAQGRKPAVSACALCHYPNGGGRPDNAPLNGLTANYLIAQLRAFKDGNRKSSDPRKTDTDAMIAIAKAMTDAEMRDAAQYFSSLKAALPRIKVVETKTVVETAMVGGVFLPVANGKQEPIGQRIVEVPDNRDAIDLRNPRTGFTAYVPPNMVNRGAVTAITGRGKTASCSTCHGPDLKGVADVPGIAGRSPTYLMRQMVDMRQGARKGPAADLMKPVIGKMTNVELLSLSAYIATRAP